MNTFEKYETQLCEYINEEIISKNKNIINFQIHVLPESMFKNIEYIFKINSDLTEQEQLKLWSEIDYELFKEYDKLNLEFDFITLIRY